MSVRDIFIALLISRFGMNPEFAEQVVVDLEQRCRSRLEYFSVGLIGPPSRHVELIERELHNLLDEFHLFRGKA